MTEFLQNFLAVGQDGLHVLTSAVLPILFPFFVLTSLILNITNVSHSWLVSLLAYFSGYPNGARLTQNLYQKQRLTLSQAKKLIITTSTPSPMFVITTAGMVFLQDIKIGCIIFSCSVISAIINGYIWCPPEKQLHQITKVEIKQNNNSKHFFTALSDSLSSSTTAIVNVCGVILFFYILTNTLHFPTILSGLLEMTTGVTATKNPLLVQFFVTFGGLSVAMQQQIFMQNFQIKFGKYILYKLTQAIIACGLLSIYLLFLN